MKLSLRKTVFSLCAKSESGNPTFLSTDKKQIVANYVGQYNQLNGKAIATRIDSKGVEFIWNKKSAFIAEIAFEVNKCFDSFSEEERNLFLARTGEILDKYQNMKTIDRPFIQGIDNEEK